MKTPHKVTVSVPPTPYPVPTAVSRRPQSSVGLGGSKPIPTAVRDSYPPKSKVGIK